MWQRLHPPMIALFLAPMATAQTTFPVYHVNPLHEGVMPFDSTSAFFFLRCCRELTARVILFSVDTADLAGDAFFDLRSKVLPIECAANESYGWKADCDNQEVVDDDLVITKLSLTVSKSFGEYGKCNICDVNGTDPFSGLPCKPSTYICSCGSYSHPKDCNNQTQVGVENITKAFGRFKDYFCRWDSWVKAPWSCWSMPVVGKTGGMWYSTTRAGWCGAPGADPSTCSWDARVEKVVNKSCSDKLIIDAVEGYDKQRNKCFDDCPYRKRHPFHPRNTSDSCWIYCYYATLLGPSNLLPSGALPGDDGMPKQLITSAFEKPFLPVAQGGCPPVTPPPASAAPSARRPRRVPMRQRLMRAMYRAQALVRAAEADSTPARVVAAVEAAPVLVEAP